MGFPVVEPKLPVLDFSKETLKPGTKSWELARKDVQRAFEEYGCFLVTYEAISCELRNAMFGALEELFDLPTETKMKNKYEKPLNGYVGQNPVVPLHESLGIDNATAKEGIQSFTNLLWPVGNDRFSESAHSFAKLAAEIDQIVTRMIFESYSLEKYYEAYIGSITYLLRLLKHNAPQGNDPQLGFVAHTDKSFTTILHQNHVNALEVETKNGDWIKVELSPSSFVVFAGDALMAWSNDRIVSPKHRVVVSGNEDRYSLAQFSFGDGMVEVPEELVDEQHPLKYKPFNHLGFLGFFAENAYKRLECPIKAYCGTPWGF
ncbi:probable 2-oxoglutarate-dependent dioxygenase AOP1 [Morus notabilis]|uniref:probable 2-oxoglutarate-dependent dioxygenase AOP1 n=1 Tax=Morus notabilis TaxID=981085 RepID=UPI000CED24C2|nr:probable 2-oxoglutarate-dependent dioxygenase AOP1 [Morus notabilis]